MPLPRRYGPPARPAAAAGTDAGARPGADAAPCSRPDAAVQAGPARRRTGRCRGRRRIEQAAQVPAVRAHRHQRRHDARQRLALQRLGRARSCDRLDDGRFLAWWNGTAGAALAAPLRSRRRQRLPEPSPSPASARPGLGHEHQAREGGAIRSGRVGRGGHPHRGQHDQEGDDDAVDQRRHRGRDGAGRRAAEALRDEGAAEDGTARADRSSPQPPDGAHRFPFRDENAVDGGDFAGRDQAPDHRAVDAGRPRDFDRRKDLRRAVLGTPPALSLVRGHFRSPYFVPSKKLFPPRSARRRTARNPSASRAPAAPRFAR